MSLRAACAAAALIALAACGGSEKSESSQGSAAMRPGENCNASGCHGFTAAGTVYLTSTAASSAGVGGANVTIDGTASIAMTTNAAGNFHTTLPFGSGATVTVSCGGPAGTMPGTVTDASGGCAVCHGSALRIHCP